MLISQWGKQSPGSGSPEVSCIGGLTPCMIFSRADAIYGNPFTDFVVAIRVVDLAGMFSLCCAVAGRRGISCYLLYDKMKEKALFVICKPNPILLVHNGAAGHANTNVPSFPHFRK
jgi:hypothetical protein